MPSPLVVQVRDKSLTRVAVLDEADVSTLRLSAVLNDVGTWSIILPHMVRSESGRWVRHQGAEALTTPGAGIIIDLPGGRRVSGPMVTPQYRETTDNPRGEWEISGVTDDIILADRVAFPDPAIADAQASSQSKAYDVRTGPAETIMRAYVNFNIGTAATAARRDTRLAFPSGGTRGATRTKSARFVPLLQLCQELAAPDGLTFELVQRASGNVIDYRSGITRDVSADVRLDVAGDTLSAAGYATSGPAATSVVVMGQGEGKARTIRTRTTPTSIADSALWGRTIEVVKDSRGTEEVGELDASGDEILAVNGHSVHGLTVTPSPVNTATLGSKWWLGDLVTVNVAGKAIKARVVAVDIEVTAEGIYATATVGDPVGFDPDDMADARANDTSSRVSALERTAEGGGTAPRRVSYTVTPSTGWSAARSHPSGNPTGTPYATSMAGHAAVQIVMTNTSGADITPSGGLTIATGLPGSDSGTFFSLGAYGRLTSHPGYPLPDLSVFVNSAGALGIRGSRTIAAGESFNVFGVYPTSA